MKIVKLDAIDSTNEFLKNLAKDPSLDNWTVIWAENQTSGRGQLQNKWHSEPGKNLTFSVLYRNHNLEVSKALFLNCAVSLAIFKVLERYITQGLSVKWPNDILADSKKLCGILIENTLSKNRITRTIIGIGLNVNQQEFTSDLSKARSLIAHTNTPIDRDQLLKLLLEELQAQVGRIEEQQFDLIRHDYENCLYQKNVKARYQDDAGHVFTGIIKGIDGVGRLVLQHENNSESTYNLKEIKFL